MSTEQYKIQLQQLLPPGPLWDSFREQDGNADALLEALAVEFSRVDARAAKLLDQTDPRTVDELLPEWEVFAGLPDPCVGPLDTIEARRQALHTRLTATGGQSRQYFIDLAATLGFTISIDEPATHTWRVNVHAPESTVTVARAGTARAGDPLRNWGSSSLECPLRRLKPAHSSLLFAYGVDLVLWEQLTSGATARSIHTAVAIDGKMYVFGGYEDGVGYLNDLWSYDPGTDSWAQLTSGATARDSHTSVAIDGKMYVFGGYGNDDLNDLWSYDPGTDSWTRLTSGATPRYDHTAVAIEGKMYVFGGYEDGVGYLNDLWSYDPATDSWTQLTSGATARYIHTAVAIDGKMYVFGGYDRDDLNDLWSYDPATDSWTQLRSGAVALWRHTAVAIDGKMYVFGAGDFGELNDLWSYDPVADTWTQLTSGATYREGPAAVAIDGKMYLFGGYGEDSTLNDLWVYNPAAE